MIRRMIRQWDMWVYWIAWRSINRMCRDNPGMAYLLQLNIAHWLERNPVSPALRRSTEWFFQALTEHKHETLRNDSDTAERLRPDSAGG